MASSIGFPKARKEAESAGTVKKTRKTVSTDTCLIRGGVLAAYTGDAVNIVVSEGVKEIPEKVLPISKNTKSVHLPESLKKELEPFLRKELASVLKGNVEASFSKKISGGFTIGPKGEGWFISFTDETFRELIVSYLRPAAKKILFGE